MNRYDWPFVPIPSTAPSFNSSALGSTASLYLFSNSSNRKWDGPGGRSVRLAIAVSTAGPTYFHMGSSLTAAAVSGSHPVLIPGKAEVFKVEPGWTSISFLSSTDAVVNVTMGYGGR